MTNEELNLWLANHLKSDDQNRREKARMMAGLADQMGISPSRPGDAVDHPYDWVDMGYKVEREEIAGSKTRTMPPDAKIYDASKISGVLKPGEWTPVDHLPGWYETQETSRLVETAADNPWANGRYALASIVWGLIALLVLGVGAGP